MLLHCLKHPPLNRTATIAVLFIILVQIPFGRARAQWRQIAGPPGATVTALSVLNNVVVATTPGRIYFSKDSGKTWLGAEKCPNVSHLGWMVSGGGNLFTIGNDDHSALSRDGGVTWEEGRIPVQSMFSCLTADGSTFYLGCTSGILRSIDAGVTWILSNGDLRIPLVGLTPIRALAASGGTVYAGLQALGLCVSTNGGQTWQRRGVEFRDRLMAHLAVMNNSLCASDDQGNVFSSTDGGETWKPSIQARFIKMIAVIGESFYIVSQTSGILRSTNGGQTWIAMNGGLAAAPNCLAFIGTTLLAGSEYAGVFRSSLPFTRWTESTAGITDQNLSCVAVRNSSIHVGSLQGVHRTTDEGMSWQNTLMGIAGIPFDCIDYADSALYASSPLRGVLRSTNNGTSWTQMGYGLPAGYATSLLQTRSHLIVGNEHGIFRRSIADGSWEKGSIDSSIGLMPFSVYDIAETEGRLFAATYGGVLVSSDSGVTWNSTAAGLPSGWPIQVLAQNGRIFVGFMNNGVYASTNGGDSWFPSSDGLSDLTVRSMIQVGKSLFVGSYNGAVSVSSNQGVTWTRWSDELPARSISSLASDGIRLYATLNTGGLWCRTIEPIAAHADERRSPTVPTDITIEQNYPNPFNPTTTIDFHLPSAGLVRLEVFDLLGRKTATLVNGFRSAGKHSVSWDGQGESAGVYFYRLEANGAIRTRQMILLH